MLVPYFFSVNAFVAVTVALPLGLNVTVPVIFRLECFLSSDFAVARLFREVLQGLGQFEQAFGVGVADDRDY